VIWSSRPRASSVALARSAITYGSLRARWTQIAFVCCFGTRRSSVTLLGSGRRFPRRGACRCFREGVPAAALVSIACRRLQPVLAACRAEPSRRSGITRCRSKEHRAAGALAIRQTFVRPLEAERSASHAATAVAAASRVARAREVLEVGQTGSVWFLADPMRGDLAMIDPRAAAAEQSSCGRLWLARRSGHAAVRGPVTDAGASLVRRRGVVADA
jgi:hypothetical protein